MARRRTDRERELDDEIDRLDQLVGEVKSDTAKVSAIKAASSLRAERARIRAVRLAQGTDNELDRMSRLRVLAEREGSWVAASKYAQAESDLRAELATARAAEAAAEMTTMSADELVEVIVAAIEDLPFELVLPIADAVRGRMAADDVIDGEIAYEA